MSEKPESCQCCFYETTELEEYPHWGPKNEKIMMWFCLLCASSQASSMVYSRAYSDSESIVRHLAGIVMNAANHIIAEIRKQKPESEAK